MTYRDTAPADQTFLLDLYTSTRAEELARVAWPEEQKVAFLRQQFLAQDAYYRASYPGAEFRVIEQGGLPVGRLYVHRREDEHRLMELTLLPACRGRGIGTALIREVMRGAAREAKPVRLHVEGFNPALRLYRRLGFVQLEERGLYWFLEWRPPGVS
ncbi:N-acetyltransferase (plasmid) [Deinococcus metallilatus]|nr:N-acetyltransferase [Deinococcus metallilatus]RXJ18163.1 N-acetyltransferase [Deinococcus metallilatus]